MNPIDVILNTKPAAFDIDIGKDKERLQIDIFTAIEDIKKLNKGINGAPLLMEFSTDTPPTKVLFHINKKFEENLLRHSYDSTIRGVCGVRRTGMNSFYNPWPLYTRGFELIQFFCEKSQSVRMGMIVANTYNPSNDINNIPLERIYAINNRNPELMIKIMLAIGWICKKTGILNVNTDDSFMERIAEVGGSDEMEHTAQLLKRGSNLSKNAINRSLKDAHNYVTENKIQDMIIDLCLEYSTKLADFNIPDYINNYSELTSKKILMNNVYRARFTWTTKRTSTYYVDKYENNKYTSFHYITDAFVHPDQKVPGRLCKIDRIADLITKMRTILNYVHSKQYENFFQIPEKS